MDIFLKIDPDQKQVSVEAGVCLHCLHRKGTRFYMNKLFAENAVMIETLCTMSLQATSLTIFYRRD